MWWSAGAGRAYLSWEIHASKIKFKSEKSKVCAELEKEYVKVLLQKKPRPTWEIMWISWAWIKLNFNKDPWKGSLESRADKIVRDTFTEKLWDQREKFKYDLKYDRQAAFGSAMWMIGWIAWATVATIFSWNILATSAWFTAWLRLWNWIWQEAWNSWEFLYEKAPWNKINDWNNKVEKFWQWFLRWVWVLDQNYEYVWTAKFLSWLWFDYLSTVTTFWLSQKFWWFLWKLEWVKFAWWALKFGMEELILENFFVDIPMNIVQTWFETFTGIGDWIIIWNTAEWQKRREKWQKNYKSWNLEDMLISMKEAVTQNLSFENLSQTFFNTVIYWWFLEWWWAAIKKMKWYLPAWQVSNFTEKSAIAATAFAWLTNFMSSKNINFNKDWKCIDTSTNLEIIESDPRFKELCEHLNTVNRTKAWVIESFEAITETQKQMIADPENRTGLLFRLWLISPTNTPLNILKKKKELVEKRLNKAKSKWDNNKVKQLQKLLDIYKDAETKLLSDNPSNRNQQSEVTGTETTQSNYEIKTWPEIEQISQILWSKFHEERKQSRLQPDWTYAPRIENTTDQTRISKHNWQTEVDIVNTPFEDLPSDWQSENLEAAIVAVRLVYNKVKNWEKITPEMIEKMAEIVHNKRLERNWTEWSFENERVEYKQLSEEGKAKDRNQILQAIETVTNWKSEWKIVIPTAKFRAPNEKFAETDESFR